METKYYCHDCLKKIETKDDELITAKLLVYKDNKEQIAIIKCDECYAKNPSLTNYKKTEVYSRIVGYLRPVQQWNRGKVEEYKNRVNYKQ